MVIFDVETGPENTVESCLDAGSWNEQPPPAETALRKPRNKGWGFFGAEVVPFDVVTLEDTWRLLFWFLCVSSRKASDWPTAGCRR